MPVNETRPHSRRQPAVPKTPPEQRRLGPRIARHPLASQYLSLNLPLQLANPPHRRTDYPSISIYCLPPFLAPNRRCAFIGIPSFDEIHCLSPTPTQCR